MSHRSARSLADIPAPLALVAWVVLAMLAAAGPVSAQSGKLTPPAASDPAQAPAAPDQSAPPSSEPSPPPRPENPGLFNEIGKLFDNPPSIFPTLKSPRETLDDFNARAKEATDSLSRLTTNPSVVRGRVACPVANGAPDCKAASDKLCRTKGFKEGKSLDTDQAQACSAAALLSGGNREPGNCRTENYVTRALCQ